MKKIKTLCEIEILRELYGVDSLSHIVRILDERFPYKCPRCNGKGGANIERPLYGRELEESYSPKFVHPTKWNECVVCSGHGYTEVEMEPVPTEFRYRAKGDTQ